MIDRGQLEVARGVKTYSSSYLKLSFLTSVIDHGQLEVACGVQTYSSFFYQVIFSYKDDRSWSAEGGVRGANVFWLLILCYLFLPG